MATPNIVMSLSSGITRLRIFKKRLYSMNADSEQMVYVYFQNPTYPGDFSGTDFLIFRSANHE